MKRKTRRGGQPRSTEESRQRGAAAAHKISARLAKNAGDVRVAAAKDATATKVAAKHTAKLERLGRAHAKEKLGRARAKEKLGRADARTKLASVLAKASGTHLGAAQKKDVAAASGGVLAKRKPRRGGQPRSTDESRQRGAAAAERISARLERNASRGAAGAATHDADKLRGALARSSGTSLAATRGEDTADRARGALAKSPGTSLAVTRGEDATDRARGGLAKTPGTSLAVTRGEDATDRARGGLAKTVAAALGEDAAEKVATGLAHAPGGTVAAKAAGRVAAGVASKQQHGATAAAHRQVIAATERQRQVGLDIEHSDEQHMRRALELAEEYRGRTAPNPIVGCVIVDALGNVIAEGAHRGPGTKHAEIDALDKLGGTAPGGTLYVNLEPCTHQGRTPPCAPIVAAAQLARVVIGSLDPIESHAGGMRILEQHGIPISRVLADECDLANLPFRTWALERRAAFTLKAAITLDGKIATVGGESQWITGDEARTHVHHLRSTHDAVLVGIGTVLADDPQLTARIPGGRDPVRVVIDSALRTPPSAKLLRSKSARTIIATTNDALAETERVLVARGAEVWRLPGSGGQVSLAALASRLADESILSVLVEGGGQIHAALLAEGLATDLQLFIAPKIVGGPAPSWVGGPGLAKLSSAWRLQFVGQPRRFGEDVLLRAIVVHGT